MAELFERRVPPIEIDGRARILQFGSGAQGSMHIVPPRGALSAGHRADDLYDSIPDFESSQH